MQREVQNLRVSAHTAVAMVTVIQSLLFSVTLSTKVTNVTHSTAPYLANFASGSAQVLIICTRWKQVRSIFAGMRFGGVLHSCGMKRLP